MKPYIIREKDEHYASLYIMLKGGVVIAPCFYYLYGKVGNSYLILNISFLILLAFIFLYQYVKFQRKNEDAEVLVIDKEGVFLRESKKESFIEWRKIDKVTLLRNRGLFMIIWLKDHKHIDFNLYPYQEGINPYKLRRVIRYFSGNENIVETKTWIFLWYL